MEQKSLISELNQGKELAIQLITHIRPFSSSDEEEKMCVFLSEKIHSSFEKALSILKWDGQPNSNVESSDLFGVRKNKESGISKKQKNHHVHKKRKLLPRWTEEVKACSGTGPLNDGYCWRKYGQKDIHGATFPRCYYRCTHRNIQGCLATKQVQRSNNDSNVFDVTYRGRHTCSQSSISISTPKQIEQSHQNPRDLIPFDFGQISNVKSEDFDDVFQSFCFPSPSIVSEIADENVFCGGKDGVSESNYFQTWDWSGGGEKEGIFRVQSSESDLTEIISASTSVTNSPIGGWDFSLDNVDFDPNFPFDNLEFLLKNI